MKNIRFFYLKIFLFLVVKFSIYLNRCVFVMEQRSLQGLSSIVSIVHLHAPIYIIESTLVISTSLISNTAYLEAKIWSLLKHENIKTGNKILWKRGLLFSTIFSI